MTMNGDIYRQDLLDAAAGAAGWLSGKRVLITGATGLIGSFMTEALLALDAGVHVCAAGRSEAGVRRRFGALADSPYFHFAPFDAAIPAAFDFEADYVVHAACSAHPMAYSTDPVGVMRANLVGAMSLLEYLRARPAARMVFLSSGEIYGENPSLPDGFSEGNCAGIDPMRPRACYPESKRAAETLCACYHQQYGAQAVVARLCHVYGPTFTDSNSRADAQFLRNALAGRNIVMKSPGSQVRSWLYVADAVRALLLLLHRGEAGTAYNVANRASVASIREYAQALADIGGVSLAFDIPPAAEKAGYTAVTRAVLDPSRLEALGWTPRYDLKTGLEHAFRALKISTTNQTEVQS